MMCLKPVFVTATFHPGHEEPVTKPPEPPKPPQPAPPSRRPPTLPYAGRKPPSVVHKAPELASASGKPAPPPPPEPPRPVTSKVRWRSWQEPGVRFWWLATLVLLTIFCWFVVMEAVEYQRESRLIATGVPVNAKIDHIADATRVTAKYQPDTPCSLVFDWNGQKINIDDVVLDITNGVDFIHPGQIVPIRVNPNDPTEWTDHKTAEPMAHRLIAASVILPISLFTLLAALLLRFRILRIWKDGPAMPYSVDTVQRSALAPLSHTVRCIPLEARQKRIVNVCLPGRLPKPVNGDIIWLIHPRGKSNAAIAAAAYE